jgi:hypothetical protein
VPPFFRRLGKRHTSPSAKKKGPLPIKPSLEALEERTLLSPSAAGGAVDIQMTGATTPDARKVSVSYNIVGGAIDQPILFNVYRSATFGSTAGGRLIGSASLTAPGDLTPGAHKNVLLSLSDANGNPVGALTPDPNLPFVVVVANPGGSIPETDQAHDANNTASFETHVLGVVVHGYSFNPFGPTPAWETGLANTLLTTDNYQLSGGVLAFNWVAMSALPRPGEATAAGNRLAQQVAAEADRLAAQHPGDVVDVQFIGHSRGCVVISQALEDLAGTSDPALAGGYLQMTMLDPHPASDRFGWYFSFFPNRLGLLAAVVLVGFQFAADDPQVVVPGNVDEAEVFYEHTPAWNLFPDVGEFLINFWGEPPGALINNSGLPIRSQNLTGQPAPGGGHVGHDEVHDWYQVNVADAQKTFTYFG